jgi:hypothetical protein
MNAFNHFLLTIILWRHLKYFFIHKILNYCQKVQIFIYPVVNFQTRFEKSILVNDWSFNKNFQNIRKSFKIDDFHRNFKN